MKLPSWYYIFFLTGYLVLLIVSNNLPLRQYTFIIILYMYSNIIGYYEGKDIKDKQR